MSHMGNWSEEKRSAVAGELMWEAQCRRVDNLVAWGMEVWGACPSNQRKKERVDLAELVAQGNGDKDLMFVVLGCKCGCGRMELAVQWSPAVLKLSPPRGWQPPISFEELARLRAQQETTAAPAEIMLTPRIIRENGWEAMAHCQKCDYMRTAVGSWKLADAADRDLGKALAEGKMVCRKCRQPSRAIYVGKLWPGGGYQRIMTVRTGAQVELHNEEPRYPEARRPELG